MANISENPIDPNMLASIQGCTQDAIKVLVIKEPTPKCIVETIDAFVYYWQKGKRPDPKLVDPQDAPFMMGSLWGEQLVAQFGWQWRMITFHDHGDSTAPGVLSPDRALAVYPIHFLMGCLQDPGVDGTIALSYNMLEAGTIGDLQPGEYFNLMDGVHRIVPRT